MRPLLAGLWIVKFRTMPPTEFSRLLEAELIAHDLRSRIDYLLVQKEAAAEQDKIVVPQPLADWIRLTCEYLPKEVEKFPRHEKQGWEPLHELFNEIITSNGY